MKKIKLIMAFFVLFFIIGCSEAMQEETDIKKQMEEAEQYFGSVLSKENISAVYPNRLVLEESKIAENWPAFYNAGNEEIKVKIETGCNKELEIGQSIGYFSVPPLQHRSFAVKIKAKDGALTGDAYCEVRFIQNEKEIEKNGFIVAAK